MDPRCRCYHRGRRKSCSLWSYGLLIFTLWVVNDIFGCNNSIKTVMAFDLNTITFDQGYAPLFSDFNIDRSEDDTSVRLVLNRQSGIYV